MSPNPKPITPKLPDGTQQRLDEQERRERERYIKSWHERMASWQALSRDYMRTRPFK